MSAEDDRDRHIKELVRDAKREQRRTVRGKDYPIFLGIGFGLFILWAAPAGGSAAVVLAFLAGGYVGFHLAERDR